MENNTLYFKYIKLIEKSNKTDDDSNTNKLINELIKKINIKSNYKNKNIINSYNDIVFFNDIRNKQYNMITDSVTEEMFIKMLSKGKNPCVDVVDINDMKPKPKQLYKFDKKDIMRILNDYSKYRLMFRKCLYLCDTYPKFMNEFMFHIEKIINLSSLHSSKQIYTKYKGKLNIAEQSNNNKYRPLIYECTFTSLLIEYIIIDQITNVLKKNNVNIQNLAYINDFNNMDIVRSNFIVELNYNKEIYKKYKTYFMLDIKNAYPSVNIVNILMLLSKFGVDIKIIKYIFNIYTKSNIYYKKNKIEEWAYGLFQGPYLSKVLFSLYIDTIFNIIIEHGKKINLIPQNFKTKISYVDDYIFVADNIDFDRSLNIYKYIQRSLKKKVNLLLNNKSKILYHDYTKLVLLKNENLKFMIPYKNQTYEIQKGKITNELYEMYLNKHYLFNNKKMVMQWIGTQLLTYIKRINILNINDNNKLYILQNKFLKKMIRFTEEYFMIYGSFIIDKVIEMYCKELVNDKENIFKYIMVSNIKKLTKYNLWTLGIGYMIEDNKFMLFKKSLNKYGITERCLDLNMTFDDIIEKKVKMPTIQLKLSKDEKIKHNIIQNTMIYINDFGIATEYTKDEKENIKVENILLGENDDDNHE
jgi:hypothetical protein